MSLGVECSQCLRRFGRARSADRWDVTVFKFLMPTLTTEGKHWMRQGSGQEGFENKKLSNRLMLGIEMLAVQGYPTEWLSRLKGPGFTDCCYGDLAGNAMTRQVILAVTFGVLMNMPELKIEDDGQNIDDIMKLMEF